MVDDRRRLGALVEALHRPLAERIRLSTPVQEITRHEDRVELRAAGREPESFDQVVIATHFDQALAMLADPSEREAELLGAIALPAQRGRAAHRRPLLPRRRAARQAWNFHLLREPKPRATVTCYMNHLQQLDADRDFCVTLNRTEAIDPAAIIRTIPYAHPCSPPRACAPRLATPRSAAGGAPTTAGPTGAGASTRTAW